MIDKKKVIFLICWLALLLCNTQLPAARGAAPVDLTPQEKQWLQAHRTLNVTAASMPPYAFMENGEVQGYTIDLIKKMARKIGATAKFTVTSMKKTHQAIKDGRAQIVLNQGYTKQKEQYLSFSGPFVEVKFAIFSRKSGKGLNGLKSLQGKTIAGPPGYFLFAVLQKKYPKINIIHSKDLADALKMVSDGKADAAIMEQSLGQYLLAKLFFMDLHIGGFAKPFGNKMLRAHYWAVAKDLPILKTILDKAYKSLTVGEKQRLWDHWFQSDPHKEVMPDSTKKLKLTDIEKAWLADHKKIVVGGETDWAPFDFVDKNGKYSGIANDYLKIIGKNLGIEVEIITGPTWNELLSMIRQKEIDLLPAIYHSKERETFAHFTAPYFKLTEFIFSRTDDETVSNFADLKDKTTVVVKGYTIAGELRSNYPEYHVITAPTIQGALKKLVTGEADAFIGDIISTSYNIKELSLVGIKPTASVPFQGPSVHMAVRKDWSILTNLIDKALKAIPEKEHKAIKNRWMSFVEKKIKKKLPKVALTPEERAWLKKHPVIRVHNEKAWPPFNYFEYGTPTGLSIDYMNLLAKHLGIRIEYITGPSWNEFLSMVRKKDLDVMLNIVKTEDRMKYLLYTEPYIRNPNVIVSSQEHPYRTIQGLFGKTVAFPRGFFWEEVLTKSFPQIKRLPVEDTLASLKAVNFGQADAALGEEAVVRTLIGKNMLSGLQLTGEVKLGNPELEKLRIGIRNDWPLLQSAIMKAMAEVPSKEMNQLRQEWLDRTDTTQTTESPDKVALTNAEKKWLTEHKVLRLGADSAWPPYDFFDASGKQRGVAADVIALLSKRLDITFDLLPNLTWTQVLEAGRDRRLDVISILIKTPTREKYLKFSKPLLNSPYVIVTNKNFRSVKNLGDMTKDKVAMAKDFAIVELSRKAFPDLKIITVKTPLTGLEAVMSNQVDAYVDNLGVVAYLIEQNGLTSLKIAAQAGVKSQPFHIGVRSDWPELVSIINKGLESITKAEMNAILNKWIPITMSAAKSESDLPLSFGKLLGYAGATLIAIILLAWVFLKLSKQESMLAGFGSRRFRSIVIAGLCFFVLVVASLGWFALTRIKSAVLQGVEQNLKRVLLISEEGLGVWEADRKAFMKQLGRDPKLVRLVEELLTIPPNPESLLTSKALGKVRDYFKNNKDIFSNIGFFIISPQDISIGSMRNSNVGTRNLIVDKYPGLIQKALDGQVNFVPAMESDVQLKEVSDSKQKRKPPTMFFIGPIQDSTGKTIAAMTLRVDPLKDFSKILGMLGRKGTEGTYAFDASGRLVTDTKFDTQLREIGLIDKDQTAALNLEIRDPGGNMLEGHHPASERSSLPLTRAAAGAIALKAGMEAAGATFGHSNIEVDMSGYPDYRGVPVCGAWVWNKNLELGIAAEIGFDEALSNYFRVRFIILTVLGLTLALFVCSTLFVLAMGERTHRSLTKAKDTLEDKVEERTAELAEKQDLLQSAEERSRLLLHSAGEGIFGVNNEGVCIFANPAALNLLGYSEEELIGKNIRTRSRAKNRPKFEV